MRFSRPVRGWISTFRFGGGDWHSVHPSGCNRALYLILYPERIPVEVAAGGIQSHKFGHALFAPKLTGAFEATLHLTTEGFHGSAAHRASPFRHGLVMYMFLMSLEVFLFSSHFRGRLPMPLCTPRGQVAEGLQHTFLLSVPQLGEQRLHPRPSRSLILRMQRARHRP